MRASEQSGNRIFISYRREDGAYPAGWLFDRLVDQFGVGQVFKDVDSIELGDNFAEEIQGAVKQCSVLLAVIGPRWLVVTGRDGRRRLDDPDDFVRLEIEEALIRNIPVIPILVDGTRMPSRTELPSTLQNLTFRNALELSPGRFGADFDRLMSALAGLGQSGMGHRPGFPARMAQGAGIDAKGQAGTANWPSPASVRNTEEYVTSLRRTWVRAGAPSHDEIVRRTGGLVEPERVRGVLGEYSNYHTWTDDDFAGALLVLDALGTPEYVVSDWRKAGERIQRQDKLVERRHDRVKFWKEFPKGIPWIVLAFAICLGGGLAIANLEAPPGLGTGNWAAFVVSCVVFFIVIIIMGTFVTDFMYHRAAERRFNQIFFLFSVAGLALGLAANHINAVTQVHIAHHIALDIRDRMIWRF